MSSTTQTRSHLSAPDGTKIAVFTSGDGPPLVLVHGGAGDHSRWDALRPYLEPHVTVHAMDRRGRGASGDAPGVYELEREFEDVATVIDAIAEDAGTPVDVYGHSYGGLCAFGAARLTSNIRRLALYEGWPPVDPEPFTPPPGLLDRAEALLADDRDEELLEMVLREVVHLTDDEVAAYRARPDWAARLATAHTFPREERAFAASRLLPETAGAITVPTLLLVGTDSTDWGPQASTVAAALPDARLVTLEGQTHIADIMAPEVVAEPLLAFLHEGR